MMKIKNIITTLVLLIALTSFAGGNHCVFEYDLADKLKLTFEINFDERDEWNSSTSEQPPLSPKKARELATEFFKRDPLGYDMGGWSVARVDLSRVPGESGFQQPEHWIHEITFEAIHERTVLNPPILKVPVRMDGTIPEPKIGKHN